jgi:hypothetical protein
MALCPEAVAMLLLQLLGLQSAPLKWVWARVRSALHHPATEVPPAADAQLFGTGNELDDNGGLLARAGRAHLARKVGIG